MSLYWIVWKALETPLYEIVPGFIVATLAIIIVSLVTKEPSKEIKNEFEAVMNLD